MKQVQVGVIAYRDSDGKFGASKPIFKLLNEDEQDLEKEMLNRVSVVFAEKIHKEISDHRQFCRRNIRLSMERYSRDTVLKMRSIQTSHERAVMIGQLIDKELPEDEFVTELKKIEKEGFL